MKPKIFLSLFFVLLLITWSVSAADISLSTAKKASKGKELYDSTCMGCHGDKGQGTASAPQINNIRQSQFVKTVKNGKGSMPSYSNLSKADTKKILMYLKAVNKAKKMVSSEAENYSATLDTIFDLSCASCHTESFRATAKAALDTKIKKKLSD